MLANGLELRGGPKRFLFLLSLVDRPADAVVLAWRALFPDRLWLTLRYGLPDAGSWQVWAPAGQASAERRKKKRGLSDIMAWLTLLIVAWGALAFGAIYDWARWPLLAACVAAGAWAFTRPAPRERRRVNGPILLGLVLVAATVGFQLVPFESRTLRRWSPATHEFLKQYHLLYALPVVEDSAESRIPIPRSRTSQPPFRVGHDYARPLDRPAEDVGGAGVLRGVRVHAARPGARHRRADLRILAPGIVALGVLMSMIGIIQKALWSGKVYGFWEPVNKGVVAFGPFINRNHFAGWMLLALPVAVGYFASLVAKGMVGVKPGWRNRIIWFSTPDASRAVLTGFALLVMGFALTLTLSRSGIGCFLLAIVLSAFNVLRRQVSTTKGRLLGTTWRWCSWRR